MLIKSKKENKKLIDIENDKISTKLKLTLLGKKEVYGEDYVDDDFYVTEVSEILIDTVNGFVYTQETKDTVMMKRLLETQVVSVEEDGNLLTFTDEFRFKGKLKEIEKQWEQKISAEQVQGE